MSSSSDRVLDLERGLPVTAGDNDALRKHRPPPMTFAEYLEFLASLPTPAHEELRKRHGPRGEPFRLP